MAKPRRDPYVAVDATIRKNHKLAALSSDAARLGWIYVGLGEAKLQRPSGKFATRAHWDEVAGRFARYLREYIAVGLLEESPTLCDRCRETWGDVPAGTLIVHDWHRHQSDPGAAERAEKFRSERSTNAEQTPIERSLNGDRTESERLSRARSRGTPRGESESESEVEKRAPSSRNRAQSAAAPVRKNGADPRTGVTLTAEQLAAWSSFGPEWDAVKAAWLSKGLRLPPAGSSEDDDTSQRGLLWNILDSRPTSLAEWITEAPGGSARKVIDHVLGRWHEVRAEAGVDPEDWFAGPTPSEAAESLAGILKRIPGA